MVRAFFRYLVCSVNDPVYNQNHYEPFFKFALGFFLDRFKLHRSYFKCYEILKAKLKKLDYSVIGLESAQKALSMSDL